MVLLAMACSSEERTFTEQNEAILDDLPVYPGAVEVSREHEP